MQKVTLGFLGKQGKYVLRPLKSILRPSDTLWMPIRIQSYTMDANSPYYTLWLFPSIVIHQHCCEIIIHFKIPFQNTHTDTSFLLPLCSDHICLPTWIRMVGNYKLFFPSASQVIFNFNITKVFRAIITPHYDDFLPFTKWVEFHHWTQTSFFQLDTWKFTLLKEAKHWEL